MRANQATKKRGPATFCVVKKVPGQTDQGRFDMLEKLYLEMLTNQDAALKDNQRRVRLAFE